MVDLDSGSFSLRLSKRDQSKDGRRLRFLMTARSVNRAVEGPTDAVGVKQEPLGGLDCRHRRPRVHIGRDAAVDPRRRRIVARYCVQAIHFVGESERGRVVSPKGHAIAVVFSRVFFMLLAKMTPGPGSAARSVSTRLLSTQPSMPAYMKR